MTSEIFYLVAVQCPLHTDIWYNRYGFIKTTCTHHCVPSVQVTLVPLKQLTLCLTSSTICWILSFISWVRSNSFFFVQFSLSCISFFATAFCVFSCCAWLYVLSIICRISDTISCPLCECCSNFVLTADFDIHSSNFRSKSWNSKYLFWKPSANAPPATQKL